MGDHCNWEMFSTQDTKEVDKFSFTLDRLFAYVNDEQWSTNTTTDIVHDNQEQIFAKD